jgi:hypothetical protein
MVINNEGEKINILQDQTWEVLFSTVNLDWIYAHIDWIKNTETTVFQHLDNIEKLVDEQFFYWIDTSNNAFDDLSEKINKLESIALLLIDKISSRKNLHKKDEYIKKLDNLKIKINSYNGFYEQRTSRNLITNISKISKLDTKNGILLLKNWKKTSLDIKLLFKNIINFKINIYLILYTILFFIFLILFNSDFLNLNFINISWIYLFFIFIGILLYIKKIKYKDYKKILVNTYRFSSISQRLFYINENTDSKLDKVEKQKDLVKYYDEHLEKEENREVKYWYAKKLFIILVLESILLFWTFWFLIYEYRDNIDEINKISDILKWVFWLTLAQIVWMVLIIVKYLFKDNKE